MVETRPTETKPTSSGERAQRWACWALIGLGLMSTVGYLSGIKALRGLGAASVASPLPLVFSDVRGLETFASSFRVHYTDDSGQRTGPIDVTPALYSRLRGPYNRRNVYGAAIAYGPRLPEKMWKSILNHGVCNDGPLARNFGWSPRIREASVEIIPQTRGRSDRFELRISCAFDPPGSMREPLEEGISK